MSNKNRNAQSKEARLAVEIERLKRRVQALTSAAHQGADYLDQEGLYGCAEGIRKQIQNADNA